MSGATSGEYRNSNEKIKYAEQNSGHKKDATRYDQKEKGRFAALFAFAVIGKTFFVFFAVFFGTHGHIQLF